MALDWLPEEKKKCPNCGMALTTAHLWVECRVAQAIWIEIAKIGSVLGQERILIPNSLIQVMVLTCTRFRDPQEAKGRSSTITTIAVWAIWKCYLKWSIDGDSDALSMGVIRGLVHSQLTAQFYKQRVSSSIV